MLDTDSVSFALRGIGKVGERIVQHSPSELCVSALTLAELHYGAVRRASVAFDEDSAVTYGKVAANLAARGTPIGDFDVLIASHALTVGLTLVTSNVKHFARIPGLRVENWA